MDQVEVDVVDAELGEGVVEGRGDALVVVVEELGGEPDLVARHARRLDAGADLGLVAVGRGRVDVAVTGLERGLDSRLHLVRLRLPGAEADGGDLVARVEGKSVTRPVRTGRERAGERWRHGPLLAV